ncbi:MAG: phospholipid carrier-dependent glycosyltransferase, partial [Candidatus Dadabacteria bacterium]
MGKNSRDLKTFFLFLIAVLLLRIPLMASLPLIDTTEGRYAAIAKNMMETGNYLMPMIPTPKGNFIPYWSKPPLHIWFIALCYKLFGVSEFSARLPSLLASLLTALLLYLYLKKAFGEKLSRLSIVALFSTLLFFFLAGGVIMDLTLAAAVSLSLVSVGIKNSLKLNNSSSAIWDYLFFLGLSIGFMTKGPVALVLTFLPLFFICLTNKTWRNNLKQLPWLKGIILFLILTVPWFILAESYYPGFLNYFFVHENFLRYLKHDFGSRYGQGHTYIYGTIWIFALLFWIPITALFFTIIFSRVLPVKQIIQKVKNSSHLSFLFFWGIASLAFFTFSKNILGTYTIYSLPAFSAFTIILLNEIFNSQASTPSFLKKFVLLFAFFYLLCSLGSLVAGFYYAEFLVADRAFIFLLSLIAAFSLILITFYLWKRKDALTLSIEKLVYLISLLSILFYTSISFLSFSYVYSRKSSKASVIAYQKFSLNKDNLLLFPYRVPFSSFVYLKKKPRG